MTFAAIALRSYNNGLGVFKLCCLGLLHGAGKCRSAIEWLILFAVIFSVPLR